eukprot:g16206.t1
MRLKMPGHHGALVFVAGQVYREKVSESKASKRAALLHGENLAEVSEAKPTIARTQDVTTASPTASPSGVQRATSQTAEDIISRRC